MFTVSGTYRGVPVRVQWHGPGDVEGTPFLPWPITYADRTREEFVFTQPDGWVTMTFDSAFATWAFLQTLLDGAVTDNPPAYPDDWPVRPTGRNIA